MNKRIITDWIFLTKLGYLLFMFFFLTVLVLGLHYFIGGNLLVSFGVAFSYALIMSFLKRDLKHWYKVDKIN